MFTPDNLYSMPFSSCDKGLIEIRQVFFKNTSIFYSFLLVIYEDVQEYWAQDRILKYLTASVPLCGCKPSASVLKYYWSKLTKKVDLLKLHFFRFLLLFTQMKNETSENKSVMFYTILFYKNNFFPEKQLKQVHYNFTCFPRGSLRTIYCMKQTIKWHSCPVLLCPIST